jgi:hypothetical protein
MGSRVKCLAGGLAALGMLCHPGLAAAQSPPAARPMTSPIALPGRDWGLQVATEGFTVQFDQMRHPTDTRYVLAKSDRTKIYLSVVLEKVPSSKSSMECRELYWARLRNREVKMEGVKTSDKEGMAILEYATNPFGMALPKEKAPERFGFTQKHLNAYFARDGICVDVHLSKVLSKPDEDPQFGPIVDSLRLVEVRR